MFVLYKCIPRQINAAAGRNVSMIKSLWQHRHDVMVTAVVTTRTDVDMTLSVMPVVWNVSYYTSSDVTCLHH